MKREPCEVCGTTEDVQAHHDDYSKPFDVRWLCRSHHMRLHGRLRAAGEDIVATHAEKAAAHNAVAKALERTDATKCSAWLPEADARRLQEHAEAHGRTLSAEFRMAIAAWIASLQKVTA